MKSVESSIGDSGSETEVLKDSERTVFEDLKIIAQRVGGDFGMNISLGKNGEGSFFDPDKITITIDPTLLIEKPEVAKFVVAHEGGHRAISRSPRKLGLQEDKIKELYSQTGFGYLQNAIEDPADNDWIRNKFPGLKDHVKMNYDIQFAEENSVLSTPEVNRIAEQLGYWPRFASFGSEIIRQWHQGRFSKGVDPKVDSILQKTLPYIKRSIASIPSTVDTKESEVISLAQRRFKINTEEIWPHVKELISNDLKDANSRQMAQKIYDKAKELDKLKSEIPPDHGKSDGSPSESSPTEDSVSGADSKQNEKEISSLKKEIEEFGLTEGELSKLIESMDNATDTSNGGVGGEQFNEDETELGKPVPLNKFSEDIKRKLNELFDKLDAEEQNRIRNKSTKQLNKLEEKLNEALEGKLVEDKIKIHKDDGIDKESTDLKNKPNSTPSAAKKTIENEKKRDAVLKKLESLRKEAMSKYEKTRSEVADQINNLCMRLMHILRPEEMGKQETGYPSGQTLDIVRAMQGDQDSAMKQKIWIRESLPQKKDYKFWHLIDMSGSMNGAPIDEVYKGFVVAAEALDRVENFNDDQIKIQQGISGFDDSYHPYKSFKQRFNSEIEEKLSGIKSDGGSGTNTYLGTMNALESVFENAGSTGNFLLTFTDGQPNYDIRNKLQKLLKENKEDRKKKNIKVGIVWIGDRNDETLNAMVKDYGYDFGLSMPAVNAEKNFSELLADLIEDIVQNPEKY